MRAILAAGGVWLLPWFALGCEFPGPLPQPEDIDFERGNTYFERDSMGVKIVENSGAAWMEPWVVDADPVVTIGGGIPERPEYELYRVVGVVRLSDGRIVIGNGGTNELRWYGPEGGFTHAVGGHGQGPGEFTGLSSIFVLAGDSVAAFDVRQRRLSVFDAEGAFARSFQVEGLFDGPTPRGRFEDGTYLAATGTIVRLGGLGPIRIERLPVGVFALSDESGQLGTLAVFPGREVVIGPSGGVTADGAEVIVQNPRPFGRNTWVAVRPDVWIVADNDRPELQFRRPTGDLFLLARWDPPIRQATAEDVRADRERRLAGQSDPAVRSRREQAWDRHPDPPTTMPAFDAPLLLDSDGNVWVKEYVPLAEEDTGRFDVINAQGVWLGRLEIPAGLSPFVIGSDWVVGVTRDELGVESVVLHTLEKP